MTSDELLYNIVLNLCLPATVIANYLSFRDRNPDLHSFRKFSPYWDPSNITDVEVWIHGASVGELQLAERLKPLLHSLGVDDDEIFVTGQTLSGIESVRHTKKAILPADYTQLIAPLKKLLSPRLLIILETEIWPNLYRLNDQRTLLFNAHLKPKSYERYCHFKSLIKRTLGHCKTILTRDKQDRRRFEHLAPSTVSILEGGNLKWIQLITEESPDSSNLPEFSGDKPVLVAGSTHDGEEELIADFCSSNNLRCYLAPRHLSRVPDVKRILNSYDVTWTRLSEIESPSSVETQIILVDEIGLLSSLYGKGDLAFVGGSIKPEWGGHNLIEPAVHKIPIITGPHVSNVRETASLLKQHNILTIAPTNRKIRQKLKEILLSNETGIEKNYKNLTAKIESVKNVYMHVLQKNLALKPKKQS